MESNILARDILPESYGDTLTLIEDGKTVDHLLSGRNTQKDGALILYWPEVFSSGELRGICEDSRVKKIVGCNGDGRTMVPYSNDKLIRTPPEIYSQHLSDFLERNWNELDLDGINTAIIYQTDVAMQPLYDDRIISMKTSGEDALKEYRKAVMDSFKEVMATSKELCRFLNSKNIKSIVVDDIHDLVRFCVKDNALSYAYHSQIDVGRVLNGNSDKIPLYKCFLEKYIDLAATTYSKVGIFGVKREFNSVVPQIIMSD